MHADSAFVILNEGDKLHRRREAEITSYSVSGNRKLSTRDVQVSVEMLWKRKDGGVTSRWQKKKKCFKICFWFVAQINKLRNLRCFVLLRSLLR